MELKEKLVASFMAFENRGNVDLDSKVHQVRTEAFEFFEKNDFPTKRDENWKYTSLKSVLKHDYNVFPKKENTLEFKDVKKYFIHDLDSYKIVFIDGVYSSFLSETTHEGFDICLMSSALKMEKYSGVMEKYFNKIAPKETLTSLNTAFADEGAYIKIGNNTVVPRPIQVINFSTGAEKDIIIQPRNLVIVGENSQVQIIERHQSLTEDHKTFTNSVTEIFADKSSIVDYYKIQNDLETSSLIDGTYIEQQEKSVVNVSTFSFGGKLTRNNLVFHQQGSRTESNLNGISILDGKQHVDNQTLVKHNSPDCESNEMYKGIYAGKSKGVFGGKIIVDQIAQRINAFQKNNSILIGEKSEINAKPQLEIFADDVKCSHGCTIGQLDEDALFYLQSRGIPKKEAKALLLFAFGNDVLEKIKIPQLKSRIRKQIAKSLKVNLEFEW
ncbi:MAG: Fe-S cluster assembly protein SufD [Flavobacteriaceae bacterium]|nr:Fe-S cluster assembly protein SufD [Flavobacteriaceae bacterium]